MHICSIKKDIILVDLVTSTVGFPFPISHFFRSFPFLNTVLRFQHSSLLCRSRFPTIIVTVRSCRRRHHAKSLSSSICEVVVAITVRSRLLTVVCCFCALRLLASLSHCVIFVVEILGLLVCLALTVHLLYAFSI